MSERTHATLRQRGFSLIEFLVAMALAGLVVAGALQMHVSFNVQSQRQQEVAEIQQTLRVAMMIIEKSIRSAGAGFQGLKYVETSDAGSCAGLTVNHFAFEWSNSNVYKDPVLAWPVGTPDSDPDWFRSVFVNSFGRMVSTSISGDNLEIASGDPAGMQDGDLFQVIVNGKVCTREVSKGGVHGGALGTKYIQHNPAASIRCFNPTPSIDDCITLCSTTAKCLVKAVSGGGQTFRILDADKTPPIRPKLALRTAPFGTLEGDANYPWTVIAENIEDMQIALKLKDGRVCNDRDDPLVCDPAQAVAVRVTLVGRSSRPLQGVERGVRGGYEDRPPVVVKDGYLRRALTSEIQLRNSNI